jgi:hypothetical protein
MKIKNVEIKLPYVTIISSITPDMLEDNIDQAAREKVRDFMGPVAYYNWLRAWENGHGKPLKIKNTFHIRDYIKYWFSSPERFGQLLGGGIVLAAIIAVPTLAITGVIKLIEFIGGIL